MAKFYGLIGFSKMTQTAPGVWKEVITEKPYSGDLLRNNRKTQEAQQVNDNITLSNDISIISDAFAAANFQEMKYVTFMGAKWKVTNVDIKYPRMVLTMGGAYSG